MRRDQRLDKLLERFSELYWLKLSIRFPIIVSKSPKLLRKKVNEDSVPS